MEESYFPTQEQRRPRSRGSTFYLLYATYTIVKIGCIIGVLSADGSLCPRTLYVYLILYTATEGYELLFLLLLSLHRYCLQVTTSSFLIRTGQASYECFRLIITIAITVELCKEPSSIHHSSGILSLILIIAGYLKYLFIVAIGVLYYFYFRRFIITRTPSRLQPVSEDELDTYIGPMPEGETCSICYEESNADSLCVVLRCKHGFHRHCLKDWVLIKGSCPICRTPVRNV
mmetsp:Transcript_27479/g.27132  ORF Transcript_27479/g.27132 Transcript_27479/m.27132 type:complete len:231 (-) Transcript_27479:44-736(-)